jgi:hypothetical protein
MIPFESVLFFHYVVASRINQSYYFACYFEQCNELFHCCTAEFFLGLIVLIV